MPSKSMSLEPPLLFYFTYSCVCVCVCVRWRPVVNEDQQCVGKWGRGVGEVGGW